MAREFAEAFYNSKRWRQCRRAYIDHRIAIDGGLCEVCHEELGFIVHHKVWLNESNINDLEIALSFDNLRYECQACHNREEPDGQQRIAGIEKRYVFDDEGQVVPAPPFENSLLRI